jgi:hypothetical protein
MARPTTNTAEYISLKTNDSKTLEMLQNQYGKDGFVFFVKLLQIMGKEDGHFIDCREPVDMEFLAGKCLITVVSLREMLDKLRLWKKIDRFLWDNQVIWYPGFVDTLAGLYKSRKRPLPTIADVYKKTGVSPGGNPPIPEFLQEKPIKNGIPLEESTQRKRKDSKGEESSSLTDVIEELLLPQTPSNQKTENGGGSFPEIKTQVLEPGPAQLAADWQRVLAEYVDLAEVIKSETPDKMKSKSSYTARLVQRAEAFPGIVEAWRDELPKKRIAAQAVIKRQQENQLNERRRLQVTLIDSMEWEERQELFAIVSKKTGMDERETHVSSSYQIVSDRLKFYVDALSEMGLKPEKIMEEAF